MEASDELHAPANLAPVLIAQEGWAPQSVWRFWRGEKSHALPESKPQIVWPVA